MYVIFLLFYLFIHLGLGLKITPNPKVFDMIKDPKGEKIQDAISLALLKVSAQFRDKNTQVNIKTNAN